MEKQNNYCAYIDEFGNTGDAVKYNPQHPFGDQPIFCLSAVVLPEKSDDINSFLDTIRTNAQEIKSKNMFPRWTPEAIRIFEKIATSKNKARIELVDKKYQVCSFIVNQFILPPGECASNLNEWKIVAKQYSEILFETLTENDFSEYYNLAKSCTEANIQLFFNLLKERLKNISPSTVIQIALNETENSFHDKEFAFQKPEEIFLKDATINGTDVYLAPNLLSFSNLYCRLCALPIPVSIIHDNQNQFGSIMQTHKNFLVKQASLLPKLNGVGWNPTDIKDLPFSLEDSKNNRFIQIADIVSGFIGRIHLKHMKGESLSEDEKRIVTIVREKMLLNYVGPNKFGELWIG